MPSRPSLPSSGTSSRGSVPASNQSAMCGMIRSAANLRTVSRTSRSSSLSSSSIRSRSEPAGLVLRGMARSSLVASPPAYAAVFRLRPPRGPESGMMAYMSNSNGSKVLVRKLDGRIIAGVCAGLADYYGIDVNLVRVIVRGSLVLGFIGVLAYVVAWVIMPEEGESASIAEDMVNKNRQG